MGIIFGFLTFLSFHPVTAVLHTLRYFYTASSNVPNFPEFVTVGYVDDVQIIYYDSNTRRVVPKQDWMDQNTDQQYWEGETNKAMEAQKVFKADIEILRQRLNQTEGLHMVQKMYGCDWDNETEEVDGYEQHGYDGEDFLSLNLKEETWIAAVLQAVITKLKWDGNKPMMAQKKYYYTKFCTDWLKKYVNFGRSSLQRTERPSIRLLQKTPSSPVTCHATGFYPRHALMFWRKDQEEVHHGVDHGEMLPHPDGTFQMSVDLNISLIRPENWSRYDCVFQLSGVEEDLTLPLDQSVILTNWKDPAAGVVPAVLGAVVVVVVVVVAVVGLVLWRKRSAGFQKPSSVQQNDGGTTRINESEVSEPLNPSEEPSGSLCEDEVLPTVSSSLEESITRQPSVSSLDSDRPLIKRTK